MRLGIILGEGLRVKFIDAGHLLGSSSIEVNICEAGVEKNNCIFREI